MSGYFSNPISKEQPSLMPNKQTILLVSVPAGDPVELFAERSWKVHETEEFFLQCLVTASLKDTKAVAGVLLT